MNASQVISPAVEVVVIQGEVEIAVIAFFQDSGSEVTIATGIADPKLQDGVSHILADAANAVRVAHYKRGNILAESGDKETGSTEAPFT